MFGKERDPFPLSWTALLIGNLDFKGLQLSEIVGIRKSKEKILEGP